jgi:uncharacterized protein (DUF305 family)
VFQTATTYNTKKKKQKKNSKNFRSQKYSEQNKMLDNQSMDEHYQWETATELKMLQMLVPHHSQGPPTL